MSTTTQAEDPTTQSGDTITPQPAPWTCRATVWTMAFWVPGASAKDPWFKSTAYAPLERDAPFGSDEWGKPRGGLSMLQLIRYTDTPAGAYDELVIVPGGFEYPAHGKNGTVVTKVGNRISRIYVSQRNTCWNGRKNWNIPKHLARFEIIENPDGLTSFKVFPYDENEGAVLFQCKFKPWSYFPYFTLSTRISKYFGVDVGCVQPPLPAGKGASVEIGGPDDESAPVTRTFTSLAVPGAEIVGTQRWCKITPNIYSGRTCLGWFDLQQPGGLTFLPGVKRWMVGAKLEDALLTFDDGELWDTPIPDNSKKTK